MHLGKHFKGSKGCQPQEPEVKRRTRCRLTVSKKCEVLSELLHLEKKGVPLAQSVVCAMFPGIGKKNVSLWRKNRFKLFAAMSQGKGSHRTLREGTRVWFPKEEAALYMNFAYRRQILGLKTTDFWLKVEMTALLAYFLPGDWYRFKCSNGWVTGFKKRYRIASLCRTNKKDRPISERIEDIKKFHRWLLLDLQQSNPQICPIYGRFPADHMFHMDQIPLPFALDCKRSLNAKGDPVFILMPRGSGLDKRQATIQLTIRAEGPQIVRCAIIFRGYGKRISAEERQLYADLSGLLVVYFQPKAWADEAVMLPWLTQFAVDAGHLPHEIMLGMDNHGAQQTAAFKARAKELCVYPVYTPPDCTDVVAPCDHHVGAFFKKTMSGFYHDDLEKNMDDWCSPVGQGGLTASERRMRMAIWAAATWAIVRGRSEFLRKSFVSTGFLVRKDRSEDRLIKVPGMPNYDFN